MNQLLVDPRSVGRDTQMVSQAIRHGWEIPEEALVQLPKAMLKLALGEGVVGDADEDDDSDERGQGAGVAPRDQIAAARVLLAMKSSNEKKPPNRRQRPSALPSPPSQTLILVGNGGSLDDTKRGIAERITGLLGSRLDAGGSVADSPAAE